MQQRTRTNNPVRVATTAPKRTGRGTCVNNPAHSTQTPLQCAIAILDKLKFERKIAQLVRVHAQGVAQVLDRLAMRSTRTGLINRGILLVLSVQSAIALNAAVTVTVHGVLALTVIQSLL